MLALESLKYLEFCRGSAKSFQKGNIAHNKNGVLEWTHKEDFRDRTIKHSYIVESDTLEAVMIEKHIITKSIVKCINGYKLTSSRLAMLKTLMIAQDSLEVDNSMNIETMEKNPIRITIQRNKNSTRLSMIAMSEKTLMIIEESKHATNKG